MSQAEICSGGERIKQGPAARTSPWESKEKERKVVHTCLGAVTGLAPGYSDEINTTIMQVHGFPFPVHMEVKFILYCDLLSVPWHCVCKNRESE